VILQGEENRDDELLVTFIIMGVSQLIVLAMIAVGYLRTSSSKTMRISMQVSKLFWMLLVSFVVNGTIIF
jgi:hypothetical protein